VLELADDLLPKLSVRHPGLRLAIVGADPTPDVKALASDVIDVVGRVPNPAWWLGRSRVQVVPMRLGAGVKLKFLDSMAAGLPFVTTPVGAEGLRLGPLTKHLVGESNADMVELTSALLADDVLWTDVQQELLGIARTWFSWTAFRGEIDEVLADCGIAPRA
jgi:glycosyltransferase involved in cell wall biosynthesis